MRKLYDAADRFCARHPRFGVPDLMRYIVIGNVVVFFLIPGSSSAFTTPLFVGLNLLAAVLAAVCFFAILVRRSLWKEIWRVPQGSMWGFC